MAKRIAGWGLIAMAFAVAIHTVIEPLYHVSTAAQPYSSFWMVLDPLMVLALVAGTIFAYQRKRGRRPRGRRRTGQQVVRCRQHAVLRLSRRRHSPALELPEPVESRLRANRLRCRIRHLDAGRRVVAAPARGTGIPSDPSPGLTASPIQRGRMDRGTPDEP